MDFDIPEELKMVQSLVRDFVNDQLKPLERDLLGRAADLSDSLMYLPTEAEAKLIKLAKEAGLWGASVPEELGGTSLGTLGSCLVEEELARTVIPFDFGAVTPILYECNGQQKERYFQPAFNKEKQPYLALIEPDKGGQVSPVSMAARHEEGHYVLNGRKVSLSQPGNDYFAVVFATVPSNGSKVGVTCFLVDKGTPGFSATSSEVKKGWQARSREPIGLLFDNCRVPEENVLGEVGRAFHLGEKWLPSRRIIRGARCVGVAQRLLEESINQVQTGQSFGRPISSRTDVQAALSDIATSIHACRLMVYEAAWKADKGSPVRREAAMVKLFATQMINGVADRVAHIYNAPAYVAGLPIERLCRHALATSAIEFALDVQRGIIARDLLKGLKV